MAAEQNHRKVCPFRDDTCLQDKCALWATVQLAQVGPLGVAKVAPTPMCVFTAQLLVTGSPKPFQPQPFQPQPVPPLPRAPG